MELNQRKEEALQDLGHKLQGYFADKWYDYDIGKTKLEVPELGITVTNNGDEYSSRDLDKTLEEFSSDEFEFCSDLVESNWESLQFSILAYLKKK